MTSSGTPRLLAAVAFALLLAACSSSAPTSTIPPVGSIAPSDSVSAAPSDSHPPESSYPPGCPTKQPAALPAGETRTVTIATDKGPVVIKVEGALSPIAAGNFVALANCGYYDGVVFHRVVPGLLIQGGDGTYGREPNVDRVSIGFGGAPYTIKDEPVTEKYVRGTVAMARTRKPDSVTSQFFIVLSDSAEQVLGSPAGPNNYQILGSVASGMDAVDAIAAGPNSGSPDYLATNPTAMSKVTVASP